MKGWIALILLALIAFGINWTAYESHIANQGVAAMTSALNRPEPQPAPTPPNDSWKWQQPHFGEQHGNEGFSL